MSIFIVCHSDRRKDENQHLTKTNGFDFSHVTLTQNPVGCTHAAHRLSIVNISANLFQDPSKRLMRYVAYSFCDFPLKNEVFILHHLPGPRLLSFLFSKLSGEIT